MANIFNFEIDGVSYSYDSEFKNSLGNSMLKKVLNKETAEVYATGGKPIKSIKFYTSTACIPSVITLKYTGDLDFEKVYIFSNVTNHSGQHSLGCYNLAYESFQTDEVASVSGGKFKIISCEVSGSYAECFEKFVDISNLEKKTFNGYLSGVAKTFEYYGNITHHPDANSLTLDSEGSKNPEDSGEDFFIEVE